MDQPLIFSETNIAAKMEIQSFFEKYLKFKKFEENCRVFDVGSGDGSVTNILKQFLGNFELLVGLDKSEKMVEFANSRNSDQKVKFKVGSIGVEEDLEEFFGGFHYVFSSLCLHWLQDQSKTWKNIFKILKPGGQAFAYFLADCAIFPVYEIQAKSGKWSKYMKNVEDGFPPYYRKENPEKLLLEDLENAGFEVEICEALDMVFVYPDEEFMKKIVNAINPYTPKMTKETQKDYLDDYHKIHMELDYVKSNSKPNQHHKTMPYKLLRVIATKPK